MQKRVSINLPPERAEQLRALSLRLGKPITVVLGELIEQALREHGVTFDLVPGFTYEGVALGKERAVLFGAEEIGLLALNETEVEVLADALCRAADKNERTTLPKTQRGARLIEVFRQGRGVVISVDGRRKSMTPPIAWELGQCLSQEGTNLGTLEDGPPLPKRPPEDDRDRQRWEALRS